MKHYDFQTTAGSARAAVPEQHSGFT